MTGVAYAQDKRVQELLQRESGSAPVLPPSVEPARGQRKGGLRKKSGAGSKSKSKSKGKGGRSSKGSGGSSTQQDRGGHGRGSQGRGNHASQGKANRTRPRPRDDAIGARRRNDHRRSRSGGSGSSAQKIEDELRAMHEARGALADVQRAARAAVSEAEAGRGGGHGRGGRSGMRAGGGDRDRVTWGRVSVEGDEQQPRQRRSSLLDRLNAQKKGLPIANTGHARSVGRRNSTGSGTDSGLDDPLPRRRLREELRDGAKRRIILGSATAPKGATAIPDMRARRPSALVLSPPPASSSPFAPPGADTPITVATTPMTGRSTGIYTTKVLARHELHELVVGDVAKIDPQALTPEQCVPEAE